MATSKSPPSSQPSATDKDLLALQQLPKEALYRLLVAQMGKQKLGLNWESNAIERDAAQNMDVVLPRMMPALCHTPPEMQAKWGDKSHYKNLIIEGDNYDSLRLLRSTHTGKVRVIYIDPPYNTGNKDWVYNDRFVGANDRYRHSQWLEFLYRRLTLARPLLAPDGVIMVSINDENRARLEMLMDEVFPGMRVGSLVWRTRDSTSAKDSNFSDVHEHVLIYAGEKFAFNGKDKTQKKYKNPDKDPRGPWNGDPLTLAFDRLDRKNLFYPIHNPATDVWYPCDANRVWAYASENNLKNGATIRTETMEEFIRQGKILFPASEEVKSWATMDELLADIDAGKIPVTPKRKRPLLSRDTPDLSLWLNKKVGFGRPLFKKHWKDLQSHTSPLSSWISRLTEEQDDEDVISIRSPQAGEGSEMIQEIFGSKLFQYPKPPTLIRELLRQATKPNDTVLDFFAGSGTTGQAVLELNAEDGGNRRFILCSSTEATDKEPDKNICRDVCAERLRRVIEGVGTNGMAKGFSFAQGGEFAYLTLDKIEPADLMFEAKPSHAVELLSLRRFGVVQAAPAGLDDGALPIFKLGRVDDCDILVCSVVTESVLGQLIAWPAPRIAVYSRRPASMARLLEAKGVQANCYGLNEALRFGQSKVSKRKTAARGEAV